MRKTGNSISIHLKPDWFEEGYYVYVYILQKANRKFYYVGMTGDRKYQTARSPFYRMCGHFSKLNSSNENQIIKGIKEKFSFKGEVSDLLPKIKMSVHFFKLRDKINSKRRDDKKKHGENRKYAEMIESVIIQKIRKVRGVESVINKRISSKPNKHSENRGAILFNLHIRNLI